MRKLYPTLALLTIGTALGCGGSFPTAIPTTGGTAPPASPTPVPGVATPTPRPGGAGALDLSGGAPVGTLYFTTNYGRTATDTSKDQLYAMRFDGSGRTLIAENNGATGTTGLFFVGLSADGKYIAYGTSGVGAANQNTFIARADGSGKRTIVTGGYAFDVAFTSDGQHISYLMISPTGTSQDVVVENTDGSGRRIVTTGTFATGALSAFGLSASSNKLAACGDIGLIVESLNGTGRVTLVGTEFQIGSSPFFSPDGSQIAINLQHKTDTTRRGIYVLNTDGSTNLATAVPVLSASVGTLEAWTASGLVYSAARRNNGITVVVEYEWLVANPDGSSQRSLTKWAPTAFDNIGDIGRGVLSPDKTWLIYSSRNLFRVALAGGAPQQLTNTPTGSNFQPVFNSAGTKVTFLSSRDDRGNVPGGDGGGGRGTLYIMDADGANQTRLIEGFSTDRPEALRTKMIGGKTR